MVDSILGRGRGSLALSASGPISSSSNGQVIENLDITATGANNGITVTHDNVKILNCKIRYATGRGIRFSGADNIKIKNCDIATTSAPSSGANANSDMNCIEGVTSLAPHIKRVRLRDGSSGIYLEDCDDPWISYVEGYNCRGPFPRGQIVQFNSCDNGIVEDFSIVNQGHIAFTEDCMNFYASTNMTVRRGFINGCNSGSGVGVLIENSAGGSGIGLFEDIDCVYWCNGAFSATEDTQLIRFVRCRARDGLDNSPNSSIGELDYLGNTIPSYDTWLGSQSSDESRNPPLSGSEAFFAYNCLAANIQFTDCEYFNLPQGTDFTPDASVTDFTENDFTPRTPIVLLFPWE